MKKNILISLAITLSSLALSASTNISSTQLSEIKENYSKLLKSPGLTIKKGVDYGKFKQIEISAKTKRGTQTFNAFVVKGADNVLFFGKAYNKNGTAYELPVNEKLIKSGVAFTMGSGSENIYIVSDPECPWCQKLETEMSDSARKKYTINMIPMPLAMHKNSRAIMYWVLSGKTNIEKSDRLHNYMTKKDRESWKSFKPSHEEKEKFDKILDLSQTAANELGVRGTPSIYNSEMKKLSFKALVK